MLNVNFVPDDYIQSNESRRTNMMYVVLFAIVMTGLGGSFVTIKIRQRGLNTREKLVNTKMAGAKDAIKQFEELQTKRKAMMKTALTTSELIEPVPRSVLLASLTNNLPAGMSLLRLNFVQKEPKRTNRSAAAGQYGKAQAKKAAEAQPKLSREKLLETHINIEGIAPSDLQVATYIERLGNSSLLDNVALVESKEYKVKLGSQSQSGEPGASDNILRQFKLTSMLKSDVHLTNEDISRIRTKCKKAAFN